MLRQFARCWAPAVLTLRAAEFVDGHALSELCAWAASLQHLALAAPRLTYASGLTAAVPHLTCLSLRGCRGLDSTALATTLLGLTQLLALDLAGLPAADDTLAPALLHLEHLRVLDASGTRIGDATVEMLTYGARLSAWARDSETQIITAAAAAATPVGGWPMCARLASIVWALLCGTTVTHLPTTNTVLPLSNAAHNYPGCTLCALCAHIFCALRAQRRSTGIERWHLAYSAVSSAVPALLLPLPTLTFLDLRGSGVRLGQLLELQRRFRLSRLQGAVLARSTGIAAAAVSLGAFVCADPAAHAEEAAAQGSHHNSHQAADMPRIAFALLEAAGMARAACSQAAAHPRPPPWPPP